MTMDTRRAFILNQTDGTVSVINAQTNALDTPISTIPVGVRPVWADLASGLDELVVVNEGTGTSNGSVTLVNIPLCIGDGAADQPELRSDQPDRRDDLRAGGGHDSGGRQPDHGVGAERLLARVCGERRGLRDCPARRWRCRTFRRPARCRW